MRGPPFITTPRDPRDLRTLHPTPHARGSPEITTWTEMNMHAQRKLSGSVGLLASALLLGAGCGPIVFSDASALAIEGTAPMEAAPEPEPEKRVEIRDNKIVINEKVQFEFDSAKILAVSHSLLDEVAKVIKDNPQIKKVRVEGHASAEGSASHNLKLSDRRAKAVMDYLKGKGGVSAGMLSSKGYGVSQPIASNDSEEGREKNRRVEFTILEQEVVQKKVEITEDGEKVIEQKTVSASGG
jgi:outer membrane protein OmpA-like peptidoglycan-associated protein